MKQLILLVCAFFVLHAAKAQVTASTSTKAENATTKGFVAPSFKGGPEELDHFLSHYVRYPKDAYVNGLTGKVIVEVTIDEKGKVTDSRIVSSPGKSLSDECLRVVALSPAWEPATQDGKKIIGKATFPVEFTQNPAPKRN